MVEIIFGDMVQTDGQEEGFHTEHPAVSDGTG